MPATRQIINARGDARQLAFQPAQLLDAVKGRQQNLLQRHKGFQTVAVRFDGRDGDTHEIVLDPRTEKILKQHIPGKPPRAEAADEPTVAIQLPPKHTATRQRGGSDRSSG